MSHQVLLTREIVDEFVREAMLNDDEELIIRTRAAGWSRQQQAMKLNVSLQSVDRMIKRLKTKYDNVAKNNDKLPERKSKGAW